jgi:predicted dehydrogenase
MRKIRIGQIGTGEISKIHALSFATIPEVEIAAVADPDVQRARRHAARFGVKAVFDDYRKMLKKADIDVVSLSLPNYLHGPIGIECLEAGKHVICEKPLCLTLADADAMIRAAKKNRRVLAYAEELCYVPKYVKMKQIADSGALGRIMHIYQIEEHSGAYSPWFFGKQTSGGGIMMDMACHAIEFCRWFLGKPKVKAVTARAATLQLDRAELRRRKLAPAKDWEPLDDRVEVLIDFANGQQATAVSGWIRQGGMISMAEVLGTKGRARADLLAQGMGLEVYSDVGIPSDYPDDDSKNRGWSFPNYEWLWENGYPQEMRNFVRAILGREPLVESGEDGKVVLQIMLAAYHSAGVGKRVSFPFTPPADMKYPVDLWLHPRCNV